MVPPGPLPSHAVGQGEVAQEQATAAIIFCRSISFIFFCLSISLFNIKYNIKVANRMPKIRLIFEFFSQIACGALVSCSPRPQGTKRAHKTSFFGPMFVEFGHFTYIHFRPEAILPTHTFVSRPFYLHQLSAQPGGPISPNHPIYPPFSCHAKSPKTH